MGLYEASLKALCFVLNIKFDFNVRKKIILRILLILIDVMLIS